MDNRLTGRSLTMEETELLIGEMRSLSEEYIRLDLSPYNWAVLFGQFGLVPTPIGTVKMGDNQYVKMLRPSQERSSNRISKLLLVGEIAWINKKFSLYPKAQVGTSVSLSDPNSLTSSDNRAALLGVSSPEPDAAKIKRISDIDNNRTKNPVIEKKLTDVQVYRLTDEDSFIRCRIDGREKKKVMKR